MQLKRNGTKTTTLTVGYIAVTEVHDGQAHPAADPPGVLHGVKNATHLLPHARALLQALVALSRVHQPVLTRQSG
jgi:hypothetical protein